MILRLIVYLIVIAAPFIGGGYLVYNKAIKPKLKLHTQQKAAQLRACLVCYGCDETVDPDDDNAVYENRRWWHKICLHKLLT